MASHRQETPREVPEGTPRQGMEVYTLDQQPLGTVQQVWPDVQATSDNLTENTSVTPDAEPGPLARPGVFSVRAGDQEMYVPFGAIARVEENRVVLGVPARDVSGQNWTERPWRLAG